MNNRFVFSVFPILSLMLLISVFVQSAAAHMLGCDKSSPSNLFSINTATGASTLIGTMPVSMTECVYDAMNSILYAQQAGAEANTLYQIDPATGASLGSVGTGATLNGMEFVNGTLYGTAITCTLCASSLVTVDTATGALTTIGPTGFGPVSGLAYNSATGTMYGVTGGTTTASLITIDLATGAGSVVGSTGLSKIGSIRFGDDQVLYGGETNRGTYPDYLVQIDTTTGAGVPIGNTSYSITGLAWIPPTYSISGTITTSGSAGIPGVLVTLSLGRVTIGTTTTDSNGNYSFTGLEDGSYTVTPSLSGYYFAPLNVTVNGANSTGDNDSSQVMNSASVPAMGPLGFVAAVFGLALALGRKNQPNNEL